MGTRSGGWFATIFPNARAAAARRPCRQIASPAFDRTPSANLRAAGDRARRAGFPCRRAPRAASRTGRPPPEPFRVPALAASMSDNDPSMGRAPSATTTMLNRAPRASRSRRHGGNFIDVVRNLGNQDDVGAAGDTAVERDPAGIAPHDFDDHDPAMRFGRGVKAIDRIGGEVDCRIESETARRPDDVVIDRLRDADQRYAHLVELVRDGKRAVAADADQRVERHLAEHVDDALRVIERPCGVTIGSAKGFPRLTVPRMVPPSRRMPVTSRGTSGGDFSG